MADGVLRAYAERYFGASPDRAGEWVRWLAQWGDRAKVSLPGAEEELARLTAGMPDSWFARPKPLESRL
ncbi:MAG TPA: hypothetical protein PLU30_04865 [Verrucomicrobiae bacterium]|nr:hypothetical protein [Verrucomicrobiae bacterium]